MREADAAQVTPRHVLCVYPYREELGPSSRFYPPLGLEIVAATLRPSCRAIDVVDLRRESKHTRDFLRPDTDLVCFSVNWACERDFVSREIRSVPDHIRVVVGGRHATEDPEWWLRQCPNIDVLVRGCGVAKAAALAAGRPHADIPGVSYRDNGSLVHTRINDVTPVPDSFSPDRTLRRYRYAIDAPDFRTGITFDTLASSVGCPFNCTFCSFSRNPWGAKQPWSGRSPESVVDELERIDAEMVGFVDDNFTHDMDRVEAICDLIMERGIRKRYAANARLEIARRPDVLLKMERAGFSALLVGVESAHDKTLRSMRKGFNTALARKYFRVLRKSKMLFHAYFIVGSIGESEEEMLAIVPFARELGVDTLNVNILRNERYSGLSELVERTPGYHIGDDGYVFSDECSVECLTRIRDTINQRFFSAGQMLHITGKLIRNRLLRPRMLAYLPGFFVRAATARFNPARRESR